jgi:non-heme chloroperoxidase
VRNTLQAAFDLRIAARVKIVVVGGSGLIGSKVVAKLREQGHEAVAASPESGVNTLTGGGLAEVLQGASVVVDVTNAPSFAEAAAMEFFTTSTANLLRYEAAAGVRHHVALSVVGTDRLSDSPYMRAKIAQEKLIAASWIPYSIVHATQFFEFVKRIADEATDGTTVRIAPVLIQPMAAEDVAKAVASIAVGGPVNGIVEIAGPELFRFDELIRRGLRAHNDPREVIADPHARYFGAELSERTLIAGANARRGDIRFEAWFGRTTGDMHMSTITVKDGTTIYYKDWGKGPVVTLSHGWPLNSDMWDGQMLFLAQHGFRVVAHDRRGHGRSSQAWSGNDMDGYADDLAALIETLDLKDITMVGHSTGGGEVARYIGRYGTKRVAKAVLIAAVPPIMVKSETNPEGLPIELFDNLRSALARDRSQAYKDFAPQFYGANRPGAQVSQGILDQFWLWSMQAGLKNSYDSIKAFSETDFTEDLKKFDIPTLVMHGEDDQIVPVKDSAKKSAKLIKGAVEIYYPGLPHGLTATHADLVNRDLLAFCEQGKRKAA